MSTTRITQYIRTTYGQEVLDEIIAGTRTIKLNGNLLDASLKNFRDKRVIPTSQIEIDPEPSTLPEVVEAVTKITTEKNKNYDSGLIKKTPILKLPEPEPEKKIYVRDFLTSNDISSVNNHRANVFLDGLATTLDTEVQVDNDTNPLLNGKPVTIKVLPAFTGG